MFVKLKMMVYSYKLIMEIVIKEFNEVYKVIYINNLQEIDMKFNKNFAICSP